MSDNTMIPSFDYGRRFNNSVRGRTPPMSKDGTDFVKLQEQRMLAAILRNQGMDSRALALDGQELLNLAMAAENTEFLDPHMAAYEAAQNERRPDSSAALARRYPRGY